MSDRTRKLGFAATVLIVTVLLSRVLGFVRDAVIAALFGATGQTDAFWAAFTIPDILNYLVAGGTMSITFIPIYTRYLSEGNEAEGNRVFSIISTTMTIVIIVGVIVLEIFTPQLTRSYLHKLQPRDIDLSRGKGKRFFSERRVCLSPSAAEGHTTAGTASCWAE